MKYVHVKYSKRDKLYFAVWRATYFLFYRYTPPALNFYRVLILRIFGSQIDSSAKIYSSTYIWDPRKLTVGRGSCIGPNCTVLNVETVIVESQTIISQNSTICTATHDYLSCNFSLIASCIKIGNNCWIASNVFICPGVEIQDGAVVFANSHVTKNIQGNTVNGGNPSQLIRVKPAIQFKFK